MANTACRSANSCLHPFGASSHLVNREALRPGSGQAEEEYLAGGFWRLAQPAQPGKTPCEPSVNSVAKLNLRQSAVNAKCRPMVRGFAPYALFDNAVRHGQVHCRESSTNRRFFMQNKANFPQVRMSASSVLTKDYKIFVPPAGRRNKANSKPNKPNSQGLKWTRASLQKKGYEMASLSFDFGSTLVIFFGMKLFDIGDVVLRCTHKIDSVFAAVSNRRALAVGVTSFIHVNSPLGLLYDLNCFRQLVELWDLEQSAALLASYPSVCRTAI